MKGKKQQIDLSVITVCLNSEATIEKTIQSVLSQELQPREYVFVDGASRDSTLKIINGFKNETFVIQSEKDNGIYDAFNKGVALASSKYLCFLNAGDFYDKNCFAWIKNRLEDGFDIVHGDVVLRNSDGSIRKIKKPDPRKVWLAGRYLNHPSLFVKKELFNKHGKFDKTLKVAADLDWFMRVWRHNPSYTYIPERLNNMAIGGISYLSNIRLEETRVVFRNCGILRAFIFTVKNTIIQMLRKIKHSIIKA